MTPRHASSSTKQDWEILRSLFRANELAGMLGVSPTSVLRYTKGQRATPSHIAARLHWLANVIKLLRGTYTDDGAHSWFMRQRQALDGRSPHGLLSQDGDWLPEAAAARRIATLARASTDMTVT